MVYVSYSWNSLNLLGTFNVRTNSLTIKLMKLELRKNEYIIWFLELQQLHSTMYISTVFELFFCKKKVPYSQHVGLCFPWIVGWLDQQCMYFRPIRLKLLWTTNRIVACNHINFFVDILLTYFDKMAEKAVAFRIVSPRIMI